MDDYLYTIGDSVICKVGHGKILHAEAKGYELSRAFDIIALCDSGYLVFVPQNLYLKNSFALEARDCRVYGIAEKFAGDHAHFINETHIVSVQSRMRGYACAKCATWSDYAEINRLDADGRGIFLCWSCRNYRFRA